MDLERIHDYCEARGIVRVSVCGIDSVNRVLAGEDGRAYREIETNYWASEPEETNEVAYLHSNLHHGGIVLRPMFVKIEGAWYSTTTGKAAPAGLPYHAEGSKFRR
ncbi:MAG: hypothetical protein HGA54_04595 [Actinobacteria bacterium]|nr:hypothetical protein [Actinomycetota bacterium]